MNLRDTYFAGGRRHPPALWLILGISLIAHILVLMLLPDQHFPDAVSYRSAAAELRGFHLMTTTTYMPLYPLLIAIVGSGLGQKLADVATSVITVWLVYELAIRIYRDRAVALAAAFACALWPNFVFFAAVGLTETLFIALVLGALVSFYDERYVLGSVLMVLSILTRPAMEPFAPVAVLIFALFVHRRSFGFALGRVAAYAVVYVALMASWWVHNYAHYGEFVRLNLSGGIVLYTGNNPLNTSGGGITGPDVRFAQFDKIENPVRRDEALKKAAVEFIEENPGHFLAMLPVKFARLWRPWPYADDYRGMTEVVVSVATFVPALVLALIGLAATWRSRFRPLAPCVCYVLFLTLVHTVTFGSVRYRVPMEPVVLILAAAGAVTLLRRVAPGRALIERIAPRSGGLPT